MWSCGEHIAWLRRAATCLGGALLALILFAPAAAAHAVLVASEPSDGATTASAPDAVRLRFSEDISPRFSSVRLVDRGGRPVAGTRVETVRGDSRLLVLDLPALPSGAYGVLWQVLAENDGHTTSGAVVFNVGAGSRPLTIAGGAGQAAARPIDVARRWLGVCLLAGLIGPLAVAGLVLRRAGSTHPAGPLLEAIRTARRRVLTLAIGCAALGVVVGVADAVAQVLRQGPAAAASWQTVVQLLVATRWGHLWLAREVALIALVLVAVRLRSTIGGPSRRDARALEAGAGVLVLVLVSVEALGSHAAAVDEVRAVAIGADAVHVLTACLWLGSLPALVLMMWPQPWGTAGPADLLMATRRPLTVLAVSSAGLVVVTGLYGAGLQVETVHGLLTSSYGRALLVKSAFLLVVGGLGLVNAVRLHGRCPSWIGPLGRRLAVTWPSRRLVVIEAAAGALLLVAVGVLLETAPARGPATAVPATPAAQAQVQTASGSVADLVVTVSVTPNRPGVNGFTVLAASSRRPPPAPVQGVSLDLTQQVGAGAVALQQVAPGRWFGTGRLDQAGGLRMRAVVRRAGRSLPVPFSWWVGPPAPARPLVPAAGRRLAPYVDVMALSLLAGALAIAAFVVTRRRRWLAGAVEPTRPHERVPEGMR